MIMFIFRWTLYFKVIFTSPPLKKMKCKQWNWWKALFRPSNIFFGNIVFILYNMNYPCHSSRLACYIHCIKLINRGTIHLRAKPYVSVRIFLMTIKLHQTELESKKHEKKDWCGISFCWWIGGLVDKSCELGGTVMLICYCKLFQLRNSLEYSRYSRISNVNPWFSLRPLDAQKIT